jgi:hypothetical protein
MFMVERFIPALSPEGVREQARREREVEGLRHVRTTYLPADELCFVVVEASSMAAVRLTNDRSKLAYERITEAIDVTEESIAPGGIDATGSET